MSDSSKKGRRAPSLESESNLRVLPEKPGEEQRIFDQQKGEKRFSVVERETMCAARRVTVTSHTAELAHLYISERKSYYRTKI